MWRLGIRPPAGSGLATVDVVIRALPQARIADLAIALGQHLAPGPGAPLVVPVRGTTVWPAGQLLAEAGLRSGDVLDVVVRPAAWLTEPGPPVRRRATVRVIAGPDLGLEVGLAGESATIGRAPQCSVTLTDPLVSRIHARLALGAVPVLTDDGSAHGTTVAGVGVTRPVPVEFGTPIGLGATVLVVEAEPSGPDARAGSGVLRPPRFGEPLTASTVEVTAPPTKQKPPAPPWMLMLMPLVLGLGMLAVTRSAYTIIYLLGYPVLMFGGYLEQRRRAEKEHRESLRLWYAELRTVLDRLDHHAQAQRARGDDDHPDGPDLVARVVRHHPRLWARATANEDFLACRVGLGPVPALLTASMREGGDPQARAKAAAELARRRILADLPVLVPVADTRVTAVVGPADLVDAAVRAMLLRLCCDHSPADVSIAGVLGSHRAGHETWLRWLPHAGRRVGGLAPIATGAHDGAALLGQLATEDGRGVTVCLVDAGAGLSRRQVEAVARGGAQRLRLIWLGDRPETVPAATDVVIDLTRTVPASVAEAEAAAAGVATEAVAVVGRRDRAGVQRVTAVDVLPLADAWRAARAMTTCTDEVALLPADTALPERARLPELVGDLDDPDSVNGVLTRWLARRGLRAPIGVGIDGVMTIDLRDDGPHALVAGTTGSGKSELLQTLICSLALSSPPDRISFLLVDYKGGAAFRECADLPHTVGYITDLSPALVARALTSLYAEVSAREELLAAYGAKDLVAMERDHPEQAPPSLLICVDEFAALTAEVPEFVDGMVNIAQRGRSLGMHLILATQRPAGVITANIRANTDLRIALRVASTDDSTDVINRPDAAHISRRTPGRAWIRRTGHGTEDLVQVAWVGARARLASAVAPVEIRPFAANLTEPPGAEAEAALHARTDLERLVTTIGEAFVRSGRPAPPRPWLPPLPVELPLGAVAGELLFGADALDAEYAPGATQDVVRVAASPGQVPVGLVDQPGRRAQPALVLDYAQVGHVLVFGASGSGKTELLRTLAVASTLAEPAAVPHVYGIDFGGGGLATLADWPTVGSVVSELELGRVLRLLRMLRQTVLERNLALTDAGAADLTALAEVGHRLPRIHVLIDNLPSLVEALDTNPVRRQHADLLAAVLADGRRVGVHVTATCPRRTGVPASMQAAFAERLVLRMTTDEDYAMLGGALGVLGPDSPPGRGLVGRHECQVAIVGGVGAPVAHRLARLAAKVADRSGTPTVPVLEMPARVPFPALPDPERDRIAIGVESEFLGAVTLPLLAAPLVVAGRSRSGRTSLLAGLAGLARRSDRPPAEITLVGPRAGEAPGDYDRVLSDPAAVSAWLSGLRPGGAEGWRLLLVDDAHLWERAWEAGGAAREAVTALASLVDSALGQGVAVVVATDIDEARSRQHIPGVVTAARRGRQGVLLQPDFADGSLFSAMVPSTSSEPLTGPGRGVLCVNGGVQVLQCVGLPEGASHAASYPQAQS
jgi:S-DNA-T family DNA segregation ATPase FtsK/SpoIIIE